MDVEGGNKLNNQKLTLKLVSENIKNLSISDSENKKLYSSLQSKCRNLDGTLQECHSVRDSVEKSEKQESTLDVSLMLDKEKMEEKYKVDATNQMRFIGFYVIV
jgi:hypothetical protein